MYMYVLALKSFQTKGPRTNEGAQTSEGPGQLRGPGQVRGRIEIIIILGRKITDRGGNSRHERGTHRWGGGD